MNPKEIRNLALCGFQGLNQTLYGVQNDRHFSPAAMVSRLHRYSGRLNKAVRKNNRDHAGYYLAMAFSWALALANRYHIDSEKEAWRRFPGICPYCTTGPCSCKERAPERQPVSSTAHMPSSLHDFQVMFAMIYPDNTLVESVSHLAEEISEVDEAVEHFTGRHDEELFEEIIVELVDVIANLCAVATCLKIDVAIEMEKCFGDGCPGCHRSPCKCGYTIAKADSHSRPIKPVS